ncbi:unnamed protein product [Phaedon cochleariae]|uniref:Uncharacterized protein n=1 Tax=Phaedon cochleariae TaxID=80249 RepID=A0A9N9X2L1_PHACE|nr:unnamed protein product [Phaedon cochleariae]
MMRHPRQPSFRPTQLQASPASAAAMDRPATCLFALCVLCLFGASRSARWAHSAYLSPDYRLLWSLGPGPQDMTFELQVRTLGSHFRITFEDNADFYLIQPKSTKLSNFANQKKLHHLKKNSLTK